MAIKKSLVIKLVFLLAFVALVLGVMVSKYIRANAMERFHGTILNKTRVIAPFSLMGTDHQAFSNDRLKGQWTLVFFGFTNCGSICPTAMAQLAKMYRLLEKKAITPLPQVVMISVDPERDSLDKLDAYVKAFDPHFYGAVGDDKSMHKLTQEMGIAHTKVALRDKPNSKDYDIEHTGTILVFNPNGELNAFFTMPHQASLLAADYQLLTAQ